MSSSPAPSTPSSTPSPSPRNFNIQPTIQSFARARNCKIQRQVDVAIATPVNRFTTIAELPTIRHERHTYVLTNQLTTKGRRGPTSWIRHHGTYLTRKLDDGQGQCYWFCRLCDRRGNPKFFNTSATSASSKHLRDAHGIHSKSSTTLVSDDTTSSSPDLMDLTADDDNTSVYNTCKSSSTAMVSKERVNAIKTEAVAFIVTSNSPLNIFENSHLSTILELHSAAIAAKTALKRTSIKTHLDVIYDRCRKYVQVELQKALTCIHLSFDLWTAPNNKAILGLISHFLDQQGQRQARLLAMREQHGAHSGVNIAKTIKSIVAAWDIESKIKIGTMTTDNATNNDTCVRFFYPLIDDEMNKEDSIQRRLRCFGHTLNLVAKAFLFGNNAEILYAEVPVNDFNAYQADLRRWRQKGSVGKLHNIVKFIKSSPQRTEEFKKIAASMDLLGDEVSTADLEVKLDNATRWNSTYLMIERALLKQSELHFWLLMEANKTPMPPEDRLDDADWAILKEINAILKPLYDLTMRNQGRGKRNDAGWLFEVQTGMEFVLDHFEGYKNKYAEPNEANNEANNHRRSGRQNAPVAQDDGNEAANRRAVDITKSPEFRAFFRTSIDYAWDKLNDYYLKTDRSPLYAASVVFNPRLGIRYLEKAWQDRPTWVTNAKAEITDYYLKWYANAHDSGNEGNTAPSPGTLSLPEVPSREPSAFDQYLQSNTTTLGDDFDADGAAQELTRWFNCTPVIDPSVRLEYWWLNHRREYPRVSRLALDILAIPPMSADCERAFSSAKLLLTSQRNKMLPENMEEIELLKAWEKSGAIDLSKADFI